MLLNRNVAGLSGGTTDLGTLKVLSWDVARLSEDSTDPFLSQISMLTGWNSARMFQKMDCLNVGAHELFTPGELVVDCDVQQSSYISEQMDCNRAGWTFDCHFDHLPHKAESWESSR